MVNVFPNNNISHKNLNSKKILKNISLIFKEKINVLKKVGMNYKFNIPQEKMLKLVLSLYSE